MLKSQEEAPSFDIHNYADNLLRQMLATCEEPADRRTEFVRCYTQSLKHQSADTTQPLNTPALTPGDVAKTDLEGEDAAAVSQSTTALTTSELITTSAPDASLELSSVVGIEELARGLTSPEVSRMFLACLELANSGDIEILKQESRHSQYPAPRTSLSSGNVSKHGNVTDTTMMADDLFTQGSAVDVDDVNAAVSQSHDMSNELDLFCVHVLRPQRTQHQNTVFSNHSTAMLVDANSTASSQIGPPTTVGTATTVSSIPSSSAEETAARRGHRNKKRELKQ